MQSRVARRLDRIITVSTNSFDDVVAGHGVDPARLHVVNVGVDPAQFRPLDAVEPVPGRIMTTASADVAMKGLVFLVEALAKVRTERPDAHLVVIGRPKTDSAATVAVRRLGLGDAVRFVSDVADERIVELYGEAEVAVVPSLYEGFSLPAIEAMSCGVPLVATTGGALPEVVGADGATAITVAPGDSDALAVGVLEALGRPQRAPHGRRRAGPRAAALHWRITAERTVEHYRAVDGRRLMLTADLGLLGVAPGRPSSSTSGAASAATPTRRPDGARRSSPSTVTAAEVEQTRATLLAMADAGRCRPGRPRPWREPTPSSFRSPAARSTGWSPPRCSSTSSTTRRRWPRWRGSSTGRDDRGDGARLRARADLLGAVGGVPRTGRGGGPRQDLPGVGAAPAPRHGRPAARSHPPAHALHSPYWWLRCAVGPDRDDHPLVRPYRRLLEWDIVSAPAVTRCAERVLNPLVGKSLVVYATKPAVASGGRGVTRGACRLSPPRPSPRTT